MSLATVRLKEEKSVLLWRCRVFMLSTFLSPTMSERIRLPETHARRLYHGRRIVPMLYERLR